MQENYLAKWLNNELTEEELSEFKKTEAYQSYVHISEATKKMEAPSFDVDNAWATFQERHMKRTPKVVPLAPYRQFLRIAAVIAVMLAGSYFYLNTLDATITTALAERTEVTLPDASEVILNADSKLSYDENNWASERAIQLEGEAFFKVAKGKKFTVNTKSGMVAVLGTEFNVEQREGIFEVTCFEGLVSVTYKNKEQKLPAGNSFLVVDGAIKSVSKPISNAPSWMNDESSFESIPLKYVLNELARQYNIEVTTENVDTSKLFTGTFSNTDLKIALESISTPLQIKYTLGEDKVLFYEENAK